MRLYLTLRSIPELTDLSPAERRRAWRYAARRIWFRPLNLSAVVCLTIVWVAYIDIIVSATSRSILWSALALLPVCALVGLLWGSLLAHCARPYLRECRDQASESKAE